MNGVEGLEVEKGTQIFMMIKVSADHKDHNHPRPVATGLEVGEAALSLEIFDGIYANGVTALPKAGKSELLLLSLCKLVNPDLLLKDSSDAQFSQSWMLGVRTKVNSSLVLEKQKSEKPWCAYPRGYLPLQHPYERNSPLLPL